MATRTVIGSNTRRYGSSTPMDSRIIGGSDMPDSFTMKYGMSADEAYAKLMENATGGDMTLGANGGTGLDMGQVEQDLNAFNAFIEGHNNSQQELISGSDFFKSQMAIAERMGATARNPAASALGGGTMAAEETVDTTSAIGSPLGVKQASKYKAGGK